MGVRAHAAYTVRREGGEFRTQGASGVEEFRRPVALHPLLEHGDVLRPVHVAHRHLVCPEGIFHGLAIHFLRASPAFGCAQNNHGPAWPPCDASGASGLLDVFDVSNDDVEGAG